MSCQKLNLTIIKYTSFLSHQHYTQFCFCVVRQNDNINNNNNNKKSLSRVDCCLYRCCISQSKEGCLVYKHTHTHTFNHSEEITHKRHRYSYKIHTRTVAWRLSTQQHVCTHMYVYVCVCVCVHLLTNEQDKRKVKAWSIANKRIRIRI